MKEPELNRSDIMRKAVIIRHRKRMQLCETCGLDPHEGDCEPTYIKANMKKVKKVKKSVNKKKTQDTILSYRDKKSLCSKCGKEPHEGECTETYIQSDTRSVDQKKIRPALVLTPKTKTTSILEEIEVKKIIDTSYEKTRSIKLQRDYIVMILESSNNGNMIECECIQHLSSRFSNYILCIIGDINKSFSYTDVIKIKKLTNIKYINSTSEQKIVDYIISSKKLFSFPSIVYAPICIKYEIPLYEFNDGSNATNFLPIEAYEL
jgi:hypothetical protein